MPTPYQHLLLLFAVTVHASAEERLSFNRDIRPILSDKCIGCHGPDAGHREADLRLDLPETAYAKLAEGPGYAIVPGKPEESQVLARIDSQDPDDVMPPPSSHKTLTKTERDLIERWIREGAEYQPHWSYTPLVKPTIPQVQGETHNAIDSFILSALEKKGLKPTEKAAPHDLLRRLSLDLTGLPPSPAEVREFQKNPDRYGEKIEQLLASPHYGERMAVPWLDAVRYADTVGFHGDQNMRVFAYRDYVIESFRKNKPFDVFTREQIAGDLLPNATDEQRIASAFNRLNLMTREGGAQPKEYLAKSAADRVRAIGIAFLGQTTGCAECHDHKYDPITARDFYSLSAFFSDVQQWGVYADYEYTPNPELRGVNNDFPFPPEYVSLSPALLARMDRIDQDIHALLHQQPVEEPLLGAWRKEMEAFLSKHPDGWQIATIGGPTSSKQTPLVINPDQSVTATGEPRQDDEIAFPVSTRPETSIGSIRLEAMPDERLGGFVGRSPQGHFSISPRVEWMDEKGQSHPIAIAYTQADLSRPASYSNGFESTVSFGKTWLSAPALYEQPSDLARRTQTAVLCFAQPLTLPPGARLVVKIQSSDLGRMRIALSPVLHPVPGQPAISARFREEWANKTAAYHLCRTPESKAPAALKTLLTEKRLCRAGVTRTVTTVAIPAEKRPITRILPRGNWQDESGPVVKPAVLSFLPQDSLPKDRELTRLDLANWITAPENPLTARNVVNRLWKQFFGKGLSNVLDDLGGQGEAPSHPELLDWLACEFRESGWNVQHIVRLIVSSKTYQQAAAVRKDLLEIDPGNRLLAQQSARRLDAEFIRDNALAIAGLLDHSYIGGPPSKPYQPAGYYAAIQFPDRDWVVDTGHSRMRRGLYTHWQRTFMHPMLANFDAPSREECAADRMQANTPQQALTLLNDPVFQEAAAALAQKVHDPVIQKSIELAFERALLRHPTDAEMQGMLEFYQKQLSEFQQGKSQAKHQTAEMAALTQTCRVILNLHESFTRY